MTDLHAQEVAAVMQETLNALESALLVWIDKKERRSQLSRELLIEAVGKSCVTFGLAHMCRSAKTPAEQSDRLISTVFDLIDETIGEQT
ncbi:MAG: hypothetical protein KDA57_21895 [Planctomycetales bacterium]|nr:hypothetical protein [Planctomycetales bacterium]